MPKMKRSRRAHTEDWQQIKQYTLWPEQGVYEWLRPVVLFGDTPAERATETDTSERTLRYKADQFDQRGMLSLFPKTPDLPDEAAHSLPPPIRQAIVDLHAEHPALHLREIATICFVRFGRKPSHHTVQQILAAGPKPSITARRFQPYGQMADPFERRRALIILHAEGWTVTSIAAYMQTTRTRVYETLQRWAQEGFAGLDDKSHAPHRPHRKITFDVMQEIRKRQENPELGAFRMSAALEQMSYALSPASCGRVMSLNRRLYGLDRPKGAPRPKREMPFKARFRHEWWSVDVRYLEKHRLSDPKPVYQITILENHSRAVIVSAISRTQDQWAYLKVLFSALSTAGIPKGIVSDGGKIFSSKQAMFVYNFLGIRKEQIDAGQPWQDYVESMFNVARRMADYKIEQAETWEELLSIHQRWVKDYNSQKHWAHRERQDGRHSPSEVLGWVKGVMYPEAVLNRVLFATRYTRHLNQYGYLRFQHWKFYGEYGLADKPVTVWVHKGNLEVEYRATTLAEYDVKLHEDHRRVREVGNPRLADTHFRSPQLTLLEVGPDDWKLFWHLPEFPAKPHKRKGTGLMQLTLFDTTALAQAAFVAPSQPLLRLLPREAAPEPES